MTRSHAAAPKPSRLLTLDREMTAPGAPDHAYFSVQLEGSDQWLSVRVARTEDGRFFATAGSGKMLVRTDKFLRPSSAVSRAIDTTRTRAAWMRNIRQQEVTV